eukprot:TRINITY_DN3165_c0_g3_i1.p2 TRINITY_DN3165_c0_g3~~TRINITY_DN3165_c0_g3_i1.p2  ORF type:complete len:151 (-),score=1.70 TRINITY_DN3165_c0_g3_i1:405-809(-)
MYFAVCYGVTSKIFLVQSLFSFNVHTFYSVFEEQLFADVSLPTYYIDFIVLTNGNIDTIKRYIYYIKLLYSFVVVVDVLFSKQQAQEHIRVYKLTFFNELFVSMIDSFVALGKYVYCPQQLARLLSICDREVWQ